MEAKKILIVSRGNYAQDIKSVLEQKGFVVFEAVNKGEAVNFLSQEKPDVIIFKFALAAFVKIKEKISDQRVIFCSTRKYPFLIKRGFPISGRFFQYFQKPFNLEEIIKQI